MTTTNLQQVQGDNKFCGPAAIAAITGISTDKAAEILNEVRGSSREVRRGGSVESRGHRDPNRGGRSLGADASLSGCVRSDQTGIELAPSRYPEDPSGPSKGLKWNEGFAG